MISRCIGCVLLIIGTCIGAGMLALPLATAGGDLIHTAGLFFLAWAVMTLGAFYLLEVNLWLPEETHLISMAKHTLGPWAQLLTWIVYLLLLYSLLCAYISGGADLTATILNQGFHLAWSHDLCTVLFTWILGSVLFFGIVAVDWANRSLMAIKIVTYFLLVWLVLPHINTARLWPEHPASLLGALMVIVCSFGFSTIIPSLRTYLRSHILALRIVIALASLIPFIFYVLWTFAVQGSVQAFGPDGLIALAHSNSPVGALTAKLSQLSHHPFLDSVTHIFTAVCITTAFLGVSLSLRDFLADGLRVRKKGLGVIGLVLLTLLPPLLIALFFPGIFITGLRYAGLCSVYLLILLPGLMVASGRYRRHLAHGYRVIGGKPAVIAELGVGLFLLVFGIRELL